MMLCSSRFVVYIYIVGHVRVCRACFALYIVQCLYVYFIKSFEASEGAIEIVHYYQYYYVWDGMI